MDVEFSTKERKEFSKNLIVLWGFSSHWTRQGNFTFLEMWKTLEVIPCEKNVVKWNNYLNTLSQKRNNYSQKQMNEKKHEAIPETKAISISIKRTFMDSPMDVVTCYDDLKNRWQFGMFESADKKRFIRRL